MITRDCDICALSGEVVPATYDAALKLGMWGYVCDEHLKTHAVDSPQLRTELAKVGE